MKKISHYISATFIFALLFTLSIGTAGVAQAEDASIDTSASVTVSASTTRPDKPFITGKPPIRPLLKKDIDVKERVENRVEKLKENASANQDERNKRLEEKKDDIQKMHRDIFMMRKNKLVKELTRSLENLTSISTRIGSRITKAKSEGKNVTEVEGLLVTANAKLATAKVNVDALAALTVPVMPITATSTISATSTTDIDLVRPREVGATAIKSVNEARQALRRVLESLAHSLGRKLGQEGNDRGEHATTTNATSTTATSTTN